LPRRVGNLPIFSPHKVALTHDVTNLPWPALLAVGWALYIVPLSIWLVQQTRAPVSTVS